MGDILPSERWIFGHKMNTWFIICTSYLYQMAPLTMLLPFEKLDRALSHRIAGRKLVQDAQVRLSDPKFYGHARKVPKPMSFHLI